MNRTIRHAVVGSAVAISALLVCSAAFAQGYGTNIIDGVAVDDSATDYIVGTDDTYNALVILHGGSLTNYTGFIGADSGADFNAAYVSNTGSAWINLNPLYVGDSGASNSLTIADGGLVSDSVGYVGFNYTDNVVVVTGTGSVWSNLGDLYVGYYGSSNLLAISNGGAVYNDYGYVGYQSGADSNSVLVIGSGSVWSNRFNLYVGFSGAGNSLVISNQGRVAASNTFIGNFGTLTGCGTINGNVVVDPGGTVVADCGGTLTFTGIVTNNGTMQAVNGTVLEVDGQVVNNGVINAINGSANFPGGLAGNGCVLTAANVRISGIMRSGTDVTVQIPSGGSCATYQLQVTPSLKPATWANLGVSQGGTGGVLTFTDTGGATNRPSRFYRLGITLQAPVISFAGNGAGWQVNSSNIVTAPFTGDVLTLTDNNLNERRSAWYTIQQPIMSSGFTASFTYQASGNKQADGVTFAIQNSGTFALSTVIGGSSLGYKGITPSAAVQINIYIPNGVGTSYGTNGQIAPPYTSTSPVNPASGDPINVTLVYDPVHGTLSESLQDTITTNQVYNTQYNVGDLSTLLGGGYAYIGFTGATGGGISTQTISNFQFGAAAPPL